MAQALSVRQFAAVKVLQWSGLMTKQALTSITGRGWGWGGSWPFIRESFTGAWQQNVTIELANVLSHPTVFACITLIASDIAKMGLWLVEEQDGIWVKTTSPSFTPLLRRPNRFQTTIEFIRSWVMSLLIYGNTYVWLRRDQRQVVTSWHVLDPTRVQVLLAPNGDVYYNLSRDDLSRQPTDGIVVPASEIIHHKINTLNHPLVGLSPIYACGLAAVLGLRIQTNSANMFINAANPSGLLLVPTDIDQAQADRLKANFKAASQYGDMVVLVGGIDYKPMTQHTATDSQLIDQWRATSEAVCSAFHVPGFMVGVGPMPSFDNIEKLQIQYFAQALQEPTECMQQLMDFALGLSQEKIEGRQLGVEFDKDDLLWMDTATMVDVEAKKVGGAIGTPNESRKRLNQPPVAGGDDVYSQQQNWSLGALARRDEMALVPQATPTTLPQEDMPAAPDQPVPQADEKTVGELLRKELGLAA